MSVGDPASDPPIVVKVPKFCGNSRGRAKICRALLRSRFPLALAALLLGVQALSAQVPNGPMLVLGTPGEPPTLTQIAAQLAAPGPVIPGSPNHGSAIEVMSELDWRAGEQSALPASGLARLSEADGLMSEAKHCLAELDEPGALRRLAHAETLLASTLAVPGAAAFYAEAQLQLGVTAAQLGRTGLAAASFGRAARMDPGRRLLAGEAAPDVVQLAARAFDEATSAPEGEVRIVVDTPGARVFFDDVERGDAPLVVRGRTGVHALRIEAAGHASYGGLLDLAEGSRPAQRFALYPDAISEALRPFHEPTLSATSWPRAGGALLLAAPELGSVGWLERNRANGRALLRVCERRGCGMSIGFDHARRVSFPGDQSVAARDWLAASPGLPVAAASVAPWRRWYFWSAVAAVLVGSGALIAVAARPEPQRSLRVSVDPGALH
jgi:hypothetical protein